MTLEDRFRNFYPMTDQKKISYKHDLKWRLPENIGISRPTSAQGIGDVGTQIIGFCGILYPYMPLMKFMGHSIPNEDYHLYFPDECDEFEKIITHSWRNHGRWSWYDRHRQETMQMAKDFLSNRIQDDRPFIEMDTPIFHIWPGYDHGSGIEIVKNPCLKDLGFFKVKDPFTAFQEISGYLGNQLVQRKEPDEIADKYRVAQHGFDKWSFRKHRDQKSLDNSQQKR